MIDGRTNRNVLGKRTLGLCTALKRIDKLLLKCASLTQPCVSFANTLNTVASYPIAYLTDIENEPPRILERAETEINQAAGLKQALAKLDDRSRRIIEARWLTEERPATLQDLADEYGVSAERIRQIESKALKSMRVGIDAP